MLPCFVAFSAVYTLQSWRRVCKLMRNGPTSGKIGRASVKKAIDRCQNYVEDWKRGYADEILLRGIG